MSNHPPAPPPKTPKEKVLEAASNPESPVAKALAQVEGIGIPREAITIPGTDDKFPPRYRYATELIPDRLWSGSREAVWPPLDESKLPPNTRIVSFVTLPTDYEHIDVYMIDALDDDVLSPEDIHQALGPTKTPVVSICQLGQNRSSALAACYIIRHGYKAVSTAISFVEEQRTPHLNAVGRSGAKVSPQMRANVYAYAAWLEVKRESNR